MGELSTLNYQLPDTIEDLSKFVLINEERIQALKAEIRAIKKVNLAREVYEQKLAEAQEIGEVTVEAARKMGELLLQIQKQHGNQYTSATPTNTEKQKTKTEITSKMGMTSQQVSQYQQMAQNPEAVQAAIQKAIDNGDVVSRSQVMKEIRAVKEEARRRIEELENRKPIEKEVVPKDYKEVKSKAKAYDEEVRRLNQKLDKVNKIKLDLEDKVKELQEQTVREQNNKDFVAGALYFISQCGNFLRDVAGYVWIADKLVNLSKKDREGYVKAAHAVYAWSWTLLQNIERDEEYGRPEIEKLNVKGTEG